MAKVIAPNRQYNGLSAGVMFVNGVGETDNVSLIDWFVGKGYTVEGAPTVPPAPVETVSREEHEVLIADNEALQARVIDLEQALAIANSEIERLSPLPPIAEPDAPVEPVEEPAPDAQPVKPKKGK